MSDERTSSWYDEAPITDEQLETVRHDLTMPPAERGAAFAPFVVRKLLAEVERLRGENERQRTTNRDLGKHTMRTMERATAAETENDQLRARLDEIGETEWEWTVRYANGDTHYASTESHARTTADRDASATLIRRPVGQWREVPDA